MPVTEDEFAAYQSLSEETEDHRWAFGTGFTDPLEGIDASVPDGVDAAALTAYCLALGDDALIYSHRLQEWMTRLLLGFGSAVRVLAPESLARRVRDAAAAALEAYRAADLA